MHFSNFFHFIYMGKNVFLLYRKKKKKKASSTKNVVEGPFEAFLD